MRKTKLVIVFPNKSDWQKFFDTFEYYDYEDFHSYIKGFYIYIKILRFYIEIAWEDKSEH